MGGSLIIRVVQLNLGGWGNTRSAIQGTGFGINGGDAAFFDFKVEDNRWYDVVISFKGGMASVSIDGTAQLKDVSVGGIPPKDFHQVCGFDKASGEYIVKCVNLSADRPIDLVVDFGAELPAGKVKIETLTGGPRAVNDMENPERCRSATKSVAFAGGREFKTSLPASSLTIIREAESDNFRIRQSDNSNQTIRSTQERDI